ncbi:hypothetical protein ACFVU3_00470 [Streptomyces sp. NPDC058052]|uniref:hypothetical protein n=1 Tax=Streptomyces sp. NPDC058052 TaxID=3346316 RepID=UPI0036EE22C8
MRLLWAVEVLFVLVALVGVAMVHVPAALMLAGVLGVVAVERAQNEREKGGDGG